MQYEVTHRTRYKYQEEVNASRHLARLRPRDTGTQRCLAHRLEILPSPTQFEQREDYFGNATVYFAHELPYATLEVISRSTIDLDTTTQNLDLGSPPWELVRDSLCASLPDEAHKEAAEFRHASPNVPRTPDFAAYAQTSFTPGLPLLDGVADLMARIFRDFEFNPTATTVATPVEQVLKEKKGVCQDFAQVMIACLRSLDLAARYVSGYIETLPPPGQTKLVGSDASHAWVSVFSPGLGWVDFDPTNNQRPHGRHITVAWGRDFSDISPLRGVFMGSGAQDLYVGVDVIPLQAPSMSPSQL